MSEITNQNIDSNHTEIEGNNAIKEPLPPSPSSSTDETPMYHWVDVSKEFFDATDELKLGELLHDDMFGLFEAMSAIEMMDPKMDAGMMCNRGNKKALNFDQAVKANRLKLNNFTMAEQIGIIDATLACLVTWLEGHSLAQTVFTNLYLHKPHLIQDRCIKAFSICIMKLVDIVREFINRAAVFEEEDFQPFIYGYKLANDISEWETTGMLRQVEDELQRKVKVTRSKQGEEWNSEMQSQHKDALAVFSRIKFCRLFYQALLAFGKKESFGVEDVLKFLGHCTELLPILQTSTEQGIQPEPREENGNKADYPTIMGFEPLVNQRLLPPTFPRYTKIKSREEAMVYFEGLVERLKFICNIMSYASFHAALDFFGEFSKLYPCVLSRSLLQLLYLPQSNRVFGTQPISDVLRESSRAFISPPALAAKSPLMNNAAAKEYVTTFLNHCVRPFCSLIQICGHNRARQRDKLAHILEALANLQDKVNIACLEFVQMNDATDAKPRVNSFRLTR